MKNPESNQMKKHLTRAHVIKQLNLRFKLHIIFNDIQFIKPEGVEHGIQIYAKGNELRGDITMGLRLTKSFFNLLHEHLKRIGINEIPQWNNSGTIFSCWINNNTCSWNK